MVRKTTHCLLTLLTLLFAAGWVSAQERPADRAAWIERLIGLQSNSPESIRVIQDFNALDPEVGYPALKEAWKDIPSADVRIFLLNNLADYPRILDILHMGATDPSLTVQNRALQLLENFSFENFAEDYSAYLKWHQKMAGKPLETVLREGCRDVVSTYARAEEAQRLAFLNTFQRIAYATPSTKVGNMRRAALLKSGLPELLEQWITQPNTIWGSFAILRYLRMDEVYLRRVIVPLIGKGTDPNIRRQAISLLATADTRWASSLLLKAFVEEYPDPEAETLGYAVAAAGDPRALPTLIAMLDTDKTAEGLRILGNILSNMTGIVGGGAHDGAWWHVWWVKNSLRFPEEIRALPFPRIALRPRPAPPVFGQQPLRPQQIQIANDVKRTYWLISPNSSAIRPANGPGIGRQSRFDHLHPDAAPAQQVRIDAPPAPPKLQGEGRKIKIDSALITNIAQESKPVTLDALQVEGGRRGGGKVLPPADRPKEDPPGLLVVLPPDGNGADATGFWENVARKALKERYYIAVAVAPKWSVDQSIAWVTRENSKTVKDAKFTVESFTADIVKDVAASHSLAPDRIFLHGAMESGPVVYACSLEETTPFKGFYILASGFKSAQLPPLSHAKNRRYLLQHSQDDKTAPFIMAAAAQKLLTEQGATVKLAAYHGGHGYNFTDDLWEQIGGAVNWLETKSATP